MWLGESEVTPERILMEFFRWIPEATWEAKGWRWWGQRPRGGSLAHPGGTWDCTFSLVHTQAGKRDRVCQMGTEILKGCFRAKSRRRQEALGRRKESCPLWGDSQGTVRRRRAGRGGSEFLWRLGLNASHWRLWTGNGFIHSWCTFYNTHLPVVLKLSKEVRAGGRNSQEAILLQQTWGDMVDWNQRDQSRWEQSRFGHHPKAVSALSADRLDVGP